MTASTACDGKLAKWLGDRVPALAPPLRSRRIGAGQSNVTVLLTDAAGTEWILRRPPLADGGSAAHGVHREARILHALAGTAVPVPEVVATGVDEAGIDGPFAVMARARGIPLAEEHDATALTASERMWLATDVVAVLAELHALNPDEIGLADLGSRDNYVARQIRRMVRNWRTWGEDSAADPAWRACRARLEANVPEQHDVVLAHGDFRLANLLVAEGRVTAVLDWELCTLGDPLADLAWLVDDWRAPDEPAIAMPSPTRAGGFADRTELIADYVTRTGRDVGSLDYYRAFTHWKAATLLQGVLLRRRAGELGEHGAPDLTELERTIRYLLDEALELAG
ncbi:phosphotransferase family protein [Haloechinothrix salitolerans]|uniref:Phosphotransferase family protein n=1 Tax=Haloechinothrix salitolerans TaxID=926830 RepID=A0ABW2BT88_9PSEU